MTITPNARGNSMLVTSVAAVLATSLAHGQSDDMGAGMLEEIVVTARKVEESLIDVPISITAVTAAQIEASGIDNVADLALQTPGFSYRQGFGRTGSGQGEATSRPSIRGMSSILGAANAAFFVDGVYVSGNISSYQLDNLQRVEVIRGPQSALFGRQTFAGAINFVTREPGDELDGKITVTGGEHDHYEVNGYIAGPLTDTLSGELNGRYYKFGGDYFNEATGKTDLNEEETRSVGGKLVWRPNDALKVRLDLGYAEDRDGGFAYGQFGSEKLNCYLPQVTGAPPPFFIPLSDNRSRGYYCGEIGIPDTFAWNIDDINALGYDGLERDAFRSSLMIDYETSSGYVFSSITAYNDSENTNAYDVSARLVPLDTPTLDIFNSQVEDFSQEFRVLSPRDRDFRWLAGVYYYKEEAGDGFDAGGDYDPTGTDPARAGLKRLYDSGDGVENMAVFAMIEYDFTDRLTMTLEGRWQEDEITATDEVIDDALAGTGIRAPYENEQSATFTEFLPRLTARYALTDRMNVYGSAAKGNKPGGFNDLPAESAFFDPEVYQEFVAQYNTFDEESVTSYELGLKGESAQGRFGYNIAAYYLDWQDQQLTQSQPYQLAPAGTTGTTVPLIVNAGESEIKGVELELNGAPTSWFSYRLGYAWADAEFTDFYDENTEELLDTDGLPSSDPNDVDGPNGQVAGNKIPQTPEHMFNASGTLTFPIGSSGMEWFVRADYSYESKRYVQVHNLAWAGDSNILNLRAGLTGDRWSITAYYDNALDDDTPLVVTRLLDFTRPLLIPDPVRSFVFLPNRRFTFYRDFTIAAPRKPEFGLTLTYRF